MHAGELYIVHAFWECLFITYTGTCPLYVGYTWAELRKILTSSGTWSAATTVLTVAARGFSGYCTSRLADSEIQAHLFFPRVRWVPPAETKCGEMLKLYPNHWLNCFNNISRTQKSQKRVTWLKARLRVSDQLGTEEATTQVGRTAGSSFRCGQSGSEAARRPGREREREID